MLECGGKLLLAMIYDIFIIKWKLPTTLFLKKKIITQHSSGVLVILTFRGWLVFITNIMALL